ncbi:phosphatidyl-myo-inositol dimannoside synthase [Candidatus Hakubella thermalkaliphila]|uniref:Phosphatidyl-myo-inositol dimannoside synthase n=1 Tax=Candidatus Hakubella thermalkaliphila TaxID=2754717 RepID=A0A6V8NMD7_9ACTN|nr:glycosyltransferase family 4 protein [Candidatus Hakubella thermalkaliphila]GFP21425.1 phosphatidyl-myo-inositol dimannoside synthase [Candidatus Hakubella thermalkaliphila]GFP42344.1 phosphatidyl-myo-inositol dimannoside synthase [Candidatus Hakubella thermalkaliphila]
MRIAFVHPALAGKGGGERQLLNLAIQLQKKGHKVEIFTRYVDPINCYPALVEQVKVNTLSASTEPILINKLSFWLGKSKFLFRAAVDIGKNYKDFFTMLILGLSVPKHFDIINCHNFPTEWAAFIAKLRTRIPIVWHCNEPPFWFHQKFPFRCFAWPLYQIWDKLAVKYVDLIITLDELNHKRVQEIYGRDSSIIRSGIDVLKFRNMKGDKIRNRHGFAPEDFVLLQVGALNHYKRQEDSIAALKYAEYPFLKLLLVGEGSSYEVARLRGLVKRLELTDRVIFAGQVSDEELPEYYAACNTFLFPAEQTWGL